MKILITGGHGFLGSELNHLFLKDKYNVYAPSKNELNCLERNNILDYVNTNKINIVLHAAIEGGRRTDIDTVQNFYNNLLMFQNVLSVSHLVDKVINFASGSEFDRGFSIDGYKEENIFKIYPVDFYGLAKNLMSRQIHNYKNVYNIRIFNIFNENEPADKFIATCIRSALSNDKFTIMGNRISDFIYIDDLYQLILQVILEDKPNNDYNCVYSKHETFLSIAEYIYKKTKSSGKIEIDESYPSLNYYGAEDGLYRDFDTKNLLGLWGGIDLVIDTIIKHGE